MSTKPPIPVSNTAADTNAIDPTMKQSTRPSRKTLLSFMAAVLVLAALGYALWWWLVGSQHEGTDDAYVAGNVVQITPQVAGTVIAVMADDTNTVKAGQELVALDTADARVMLDAATAQLAQTVREVRTLYANNGALNSTVASHEADVARLRSLVAKAQDEVQRRVGLVASGAVSKEELQRVQTDLDSARNQLVAATAVTSAAREQLGSNQALTEGIAVDQHPNVLRAAAQLRSAYLSLNRSSIVAPLAGQVAKRSVQVGQRVQPGSVLMSLVPLDHLWVDANFKEAQLRKMRIGQPVTLTTDLYGSKVKYQGTVAGLAAGTGNAFALLPAQNATGNWIKIVQRVPVRIALQDKDLIEHPLRVGLSVSAEVDTANQQGPSVASVNAPILANQTTAYSQQIAGADALVQNIIAANLGKTKSTADMPSVVHEPAHGPARAKS